MKERKATRIMPRVAMAILLTLSALAFAGASCEKQDRKDAQPTAPPSKDAGVLQEDLSSAASAKPDTLGPDAPALMMITGLKGYTEPCGCTLDIMLGGLDRIVRYVDDAKPLYPASALVDGGDLYFERAELADHEVKQEKARVELVQMAVKRLAPVATIPGERDFALGTAFYEGLVRDAGLKPIGNLEIGGTALPVSMETTLGNTRVRLIGVAQDELYKDIDGVAVTDAKTAIESGLQGVDPQTVIVLLTHGKLGWVKSLLGDHPEVDFALVGHDPRETDQTDHVENGGHTLEPYDQGRFVGVLKLHVVNDQPLENALAGGATDLEKLERQIEHVNESINKIPPAQAGEEPPMLLTLRKRLGDLEARRDEIKRGAISAPPDKNWFIWRTIPIAPELAVDPALEKARKGYNKSLKALSEAVDRQVVPPVPGEPFYIGTDQCAMCHVEEHNFWKDTPHGNAFDTLVKRDKDFDLSCVGCHVVGYEKPGGSVVGKVRYEASLQPNPDAPAIKWTKDLRDVGCENCHGPGSMHRLEPVGIDGQPQHIQLSSTPETCGQCHVPEHSPRFQYDAYIQKVTGKGHELRDK